ncbi:MAG: protein YgfX [Gammaproteobacteria bacterium]
MKNSIPVLRLEPRRSLWLAGLLLLAHAGALALLLLVPLPARIKILLACLVGGSLILTLNTYALLRGRWAIVSAVCEGDGQWSLRTATGREFDVRLLPGSYVNTALVILNFSVDKGWRNYSMVLMPDSLDTLTLRRLRVQLLHPPAPNPQNSAA